MLDSSAMTIRFGHQTPNPSIKRTLLLVNNRSFPVPFSTTTLALIVALFVGASVGAYAQGLRDRNWSSVRSCPACLRSNDRPCEC